MSKKLFMAALACAAVLPAGPALAGDLFVLDFSDGGLGSYVQVDGAYVSVSEAVAYTSVSPGYHTVSWSWNGSSYSATVYLSSENAVPPYANYPETWCVEIKGSSWLVPSPDDCDEDLFWMVE